VGSRKKQSTIKKRISAVYPPALMPDFPPPRFVRAPEVAELPVALYNMAERYFTTLRRDLEG